jgi:hypothetical protein
VLNSIARGVFIGVLGVVTDLIKSVIHQVLAGRLRHVAGQPSSTASTDDMNGGSRSSVRRGNYRFGGDVTQNDPASNQHDSNPAIAAPLLLWLSTMHCTIDLTTRAFPCLWIEDTNKNTEEHNLENCRWLIKHSSWGLTNRSIGELFLTE